MAPRRRARPRRPPPVGLIALTEFEAAFAGLPFHTERTEIACPLPLYARVMGEAFEHLPRSVAEMHRVHGAALGVGRASVERGRHPLARLLGALMRFPPAMAKGPVSVWFSERDGVETWERDFGGARFRSRLAQAGALVTERFGPLAFHFDLRPEPDGLSMQLRAWRFGPLRLPLALAPRLTARESERDGRFHFDGAAALPWMAQVVRYRGWLERS